MILILFHELGHFLTAKLCGWKTDQICLYPYGGVSKFTNFVNVSLDQEFLVLIMGPITQIITYHILCFLLPDKYFLIITSYHKFLLWFNLLPIYPLDGGRLWNLLFCKFFAFQKSFQLIVWISYMTIFLFFFYFLMDYSFFFLAVLFLLIIKLQKEKEEFPYIFHKFLLERCLYCWNFSKKKVIFCEQQMKKDTYHFFLRNKEYIREEEYLRKKFSI